MIERIALGWFLLGALVVGTAVAWLLTQPTTSYDVPRTVRYGIEVENQSASPVAGATLFVRAPVGNTPSQTVRDLSADLSFEIQRDGLGNQLMVFELPPIGPYSSLPIRIQAKLAMASRPNAADAQTGRFTKPSPRIQSDHPSIRATADVLAGEGGSRLEDTYRWVAGNVERGDYDAIDRGALHALRTRQGDCSEFAYLNAALARSQGIPARVVEGYVIKDDSYLDPASFHAWAEFWDGRSWIPVDSHRQAFNKFPERYLAMHVIADSTHGQSEIKRFKVVGSDLTARMN